jgi:hypothetical protein
MKKRSAGPNNYKLYELCFIRTGVLLTLKFDVNYLRTVVMKTTSL